MAKKFVPVMITPFTSDVKIDFTTLKNLIDLYLAAGVKGFFANCQSSEMYSITNDEKLALTKTVVDHVNGRVPVVATGSFGKTIEDKAAFTKKIYDTGIESVVLITSHYAGVTESDDVLQSNIDKMFALTGNIPLGFYECPAPYKRVLSAAMLKTLADTGRVKYHKDTCCDKDAVKAKLLATKNSDLQFFDAHTPNALTSLRDGAAGLSAIAGNFYPEIMVWLCENAENPAKKDEVEWLHQELCKVDPIIHKAYPLSPKYFLQLRGFEIEEISRNLVIEPTPQERAALQQIHTTVQGWFEKLNIPSAIEAIV